MFSRLFKRNKKNTELGVIFDIGSSSVGGALVVFSSSEKPLILYTTRKEIAFSSEVEPERLLLSMKRTLKSVALDIQKNGLKRVNFRTMKIKRVRSAYCTFSAPWYLAQPKHIKNTYKEKKSIDARFIKKILEEEEELFLTDAIKEYGSIEKNSLYLLEHTLLKVEIDGYEITEFHNQKTDNLELSLFSTMTPEKVAEGAIDVVSEVFHLESFHLHSFALNSFSVVRDILGLHTFLLVDISGEVTEVTLVRDGKILESGTFPFGINTFARRAGVLLKLSNEDVFSLMSLKSEEEKSVLIFDEKKEKTLHEVETEWCQQFSDLIKDFGRNNVISSHMVLMTDARFSSFFKRLFQQEPVVKNLSYGFTPDITIASYEKFEEYVQTAKDVKKDTFLSMETIFFNTFHEIYDEGGLDTFHS